MPVLLWSDILLYILAVVIAILVYNRAKDPRARGQWRKAFAHRSRKIAFAFLIVFATIGLLDSLHYRINLGTGPDNVTDYSVQVYSVLDWLLRPISNHTEASYSAPLATHLFSKQMQIASNGDITWISPKLQYKYHIFGTDKVGVDVLYASLKSVRTGLVIGILTTFISLPFAILFGAMAGYFRGWVDDWIQYMYITLSSVPGVLLIAAAVLSLDSIMQRHDGMFESMAQRSDMRLILLCAVLGLSSWTSLCRIIRGETLKLREQEFIVASKVLGLSSWQIILKHIVPNLMHIILISIVLDFSGLVLAEAVLSYVGVGVDPASFSWGNMINSARMEMGREPIIWWTLCGAFVLMFSLVLAANIFADGVQDAFDPKAN